jgi:hypothetical protein
MANKRRSSLMTLKGYGLAALINKNQAVITSSRRIQTRLQSNMFPTFTVSWTPLPKNGPILPLLSNGEGEFLFLPSTHPQVHLSFYRLQLITVALMFPSRLHMMHNLMFLLRSYINMMLELYLLKLQPRVSTLRLIEFLIAWITIHLPTKCRKQVITKTATLHLIPDVMTLLSTHRDFIHHYSITTKSPIYRECITLFPSTSI